MPHRHYFCLAVDPAAFRRGLVSRPTRFAWSIATHVCRWTCKKNIYPLIYRQNAHLFSRFQGMFLNIFSSGNHMLLSLQEFMADNFYTPAFENYAVPWWNVIGTQQMWHHRYHKCTAVCNQFLSRTVAPVPWVYGRSHYRGLLCLNVSHTISYSCLCKEIFTWKGRACHWRLAFVWFYLLLGYACKNDPSVSNIRSTPFHFYGDMLPKVP